MKRFFAFLMAGGLLAAVAACTKTGAQDNALPEPSPAAEATSDSAQPDAEPVADVRPATSSASATRLPITPASTSAASTSANERTAANDRSAGGPLAVRIPFGLVTLIGDVKIPAAETGTLIEVKVTEGDSIGQKDVIAVIDNRDTLAKRRMAEGELSVASEQAESDAELEAAKKAAEVAHAEWQQLEDIRSKNPGAVSLQEARRARFQYERALAQIKVAQTDREVARLTMNVKQAQLDATDNELDRREIKSPLKGEVVEVLKKVGEWVQPGEPVARVVSLDKLYVEGFVQASEVTASELENKNVNVKVFLTRDKEHNVKGKINYVSPLVEGSGRSRQFRVRAEIENTFADGHWVIQPGAMAEMTIELSPPAAPIRASAGSTSGNRPTTNVSANAKGNATKVDAAKPDSSKLTPPSEATKKADSGAKSSAPSFPKLPRLPSFDNGGDKKVESLKPVAPEEDSKDVQEPQEETPEPRRTARPF